LRALAPAGQGQTGVQARQASRLSRQDVLRKAICNKVLKIAILIIKKNAFLRTCVLRTQYEAAGD
jgi:hypothetical protein